MLLLWISSLLEGVAVLSRVSFGLGLRFHLWRALAASVCSAQRWGRVYWKQSLGYSTNLGIGEQREKSREMKDPPYPSGSCHVVGKRGLIHTEKFMRRLKKQGWRSNPGWMELVKTSPLEGMVEMNLLL